MTFFNTAQLSGDDDPADSFVNFGNVNFNISGLLTGLNFSVSEISGTDLRLNLFKRTQAVPEPDTLGLFGLGLVPLGGGLGWRKRRGGRTHI